MKRWLFSIQAKNNEEYKHVIRLRMRIMVVAMILGLLTLTAALLATLVWHVTLGDFMLGVYSGTGSGLFISALVMWIWCKSLLKNEEKLKKERLKDTDERLQAIGQKSFHTASVLLIAFLYIAALVGGAFHPFLIFLLFGAVVLFAVIYSIAYKIYEKNM